MRKADRLETEADAYAAREEEREFRVRELFACTVEDCAAELGRLGVQHAKTEMILGPEKTHRYKGLLGIWHTETVRDWIPSPPGWWLNLPVDDGSGSARTVPLWLFDGGRRWRVGMGTFDTYDTRPPWDLPSWGEKETYPESRYDGGGTKTNEWETTVELDDRAKGELALVTSFTWYGRTGETRAPLVPLLAQLVARLAVEQGRLEH